MQATDPKLHKLFVRHLKDAHAMETHALLLNTSLAATTTDPVLRRRIEQHVAETKTHVSRLLARLNAIGEKASRGKVALLNVAALGKGTTDKVRGEKPFKNARDAYTAEHLEVAVYRVLEELATRVGDPATAEAARMNREEDAAVATFLEAHWGRVTDRLLDGPIDKSEGARAPQVGQMEAAHGS